MAIAMEKANINSFLAENNFKKMLEDDIYHCFALEGGII